MLWLSIIPTPEGAGIISAQPAMLFGLADLHGSHRGLCFGLSRVDLAGIAHDNHRGSGRPLLHDGAALRGGVLHDVQCGLAQRRGQRVRLKQLAQGSSWSCVPPGCLKDYSFWVPWFGAATTLLFNVRS